MTRLYFIIFLLTSELFTTPSQGIPIGYTRGCNQRYLRRRERHMNKSLKTPWKTEKSQKPHSHIKINCDCPEFENLKPQNFEKCPSVEDDPETWFVKEYKVQDTRPQKCILCSVSSDTENPPTETSQKKSFDFNGEFKKCTLHCDKDWLVLRCIRHTKICPRFSRENCAPVICTKFLQISEPEKLKNSALSAILQGKGLSFRQRDKLPPA